MPEWEADLGWEDALEWAGSGVPGLSRLGSKVMGTSEAGVTAPGWQVNTLYDDPTAQAAQDEIAMQQAIARGQTMDPATRRMQEQFALAGNQAYGAAMAAPLKNAATRGRFARGGQRAISQYAPETLAAQGLMGQEQAQQALMGVLGGRQSLMQQELERSKGAGVGQKMLEEEALGAARAAASGGISSAVGTFLPMLKDGGVVPGDKDEAVPIVAHGGEVVLSEDVSKKLLKALAGKDKGTLQAFERDAPQRDPAKPFSPAELDAMRAPLIESPEHQHHMAMRAADNRVAMQPTIRPFDRGRRKVEGDEWVILPQGSDPDEYMYGNQATGELLRTRIPPHRIEIEKSGRANDLTRQNMPYMLRGSTQQPPRLGDLPHGPAMPQPQYDALSDLDKRIDDLERGK